MSQRTFLRIFFCSVLMTGMLSAGALYHSASALQPSDELKESINHMQKILQTESVAEVETRGQISEEMDHLFDFHEMSKLVLGRYWDLHPSKHGEFVFAFSGFIKRLSFSHLDKLKSARVHVLSESTGINTSQVKIELQGNEIYKLDINMHRIQGSWMVYDIGVEGISLIQNFRVQFARKLKQGSIDDLIKEIREKKNS